MTNQLISHMTHAALSSLAPRASHYADQIQDQNTVKATVFFKVLDFFKMYLFIFIFIAD